MGLWRRIFFSVKTLQKEDAFSRNHTADFEFPFFYAGDKQYDTSLWCYTVESSPSQSCNKDNQWCSYTALCNWCRWTILSAFWLSLISVYSGLLDCNSIIIPSLSKWFHFPPWGLQSISFGKWCFQILSWIFKLYHLYIRRKVVREN